VRLIWSPENPAENQESKGCTKVCCWTGQTRRPTSPTWRGRSQQGLPLRVVRAVDSNRGPRTRNCPDRTAQTSGGQPPAGPWRNRGYYLCQRW